MNHALRARYNTIASRWNGDAYAQTRRDDLIPTLIATAALRSGDYVLDVMCGTGNLTRALQAIPNLQLTTLDFSAEMLVHVPTDVERIQASVLETGFASDRFHKAFLRSALYDLRREEQLLALRELRRILRRGGILVLQTYHTDERTCDVHNELVNRKDRAAGFCQDPMGWPRYFATKAELERWFEEAGFELCCVLEFQGRMHYQRTIELAGRKSEDWLAYVQSLPPQTQQDIHLHFEEDGTISYEFPGVVYRLAAI